MKQRAFLAILPAATLALTGCMRPAANTQWQKGWTSVAVRFALPEEPQYFSDSAATFNAHLASQNSTGYTGWVQGESQVGLVDANTPTGHDNYHVALWGNGFAGNEVTYRLTALKPGDYNFACFDNNKSKAMQGWMNVNFGQSDLVSILQGWKELIPQQKQALAYDFELTGGMEGANIAAFKDLRRDLRAFDRLEKQIDRAIQREVRLQARQWQRNQDLFAGAQLLMLPGGQGAFYPTTQPAFSPAELASIHEGQPLTKMLLVADYDDAQWKLQHVTEVVSDLMRIKSVLTEEVDRLQRRKRFYQLTDHIYNHDKKFVQNQERLETALAMIDRINDHIGQLRERRLALSFVSELVAPDESFRLLEQERSELVREQTVLDAQKQRLDLLFAEADPGSPKRVALERERQEIVKALDTVSDQMDRLGSARVALQNMKESTQIIHRQGDSRLLAASFVDVDVPFYVRDAVQDEALVTVRLQPAQGIYAPQQSEALRASYKETEQHWQQGQQGQSWNKNGHNNSNPWNNPQNGNSNDSKWQNP